VPTGFAPRENDAYSPAAKPSKTAKTLPHVTALWGRLFEDGRLIELGMALERELAHSIQRPPLFA
jgi:hypothetical protein